MIGPAFLILMRAAAGTAQAFAGPQGDALIEQFLASKKTPDLDPSEIGRARVDLNGDGKAALLLVWVQRGPTDFYHPLTVFIDAGKKDRTLTTPRAGETTRLGVRGGVILVEETTRGPQDPRCCPSGVKQARDRWDGMTIQQLPQHGEGA